MSILRSASAVWNHPLNRGHRVRAMGRVVHWQITSRRAGGRKLTRPLVDGVIIRIARGMHGATGNLYCGLLEPQEMAFALHFLRPEDFFVDVGANMGVFTLLAAGAVGAEVYAFEPAPQTFQHLRENVDANGLSERCTLYPFIVGEAEGSAFFTRDHDAQNHVATAEEREHAVEVIEVSLDAFLGPRVPTLIKIDVEGFETNVVAGASRTLADPALQGVLIELVNEGKRYGFDEDLVHRQLIELGLRPCLYDAVRREVHEGVATEGPGAGRASIYLRDPAAAQARVSTARRFRLINGPI